MSEHMSRRRRERQKLHQEKKKKGKFKKILLTLITLTILLIGSFTAYTYFNFKNSTNKGYKGVDYVSQVDPNFKKFSVLILGIDENDSRAAEGQTRENSRTDSMILASINKDKGRMDMISIPRDSLALIRTKEDKINDNAYFYDKITHAHAFNGIEGTIDAVKNLFDTPINFYVLINFKAFEQTVNAFGGIDLYVPFDMDEQNANGEMQTVKLKKGWHTLNGEQALAFCRSRYYDSDIDRGQRQLQAIHALIDKAKSLNALTKINEVINIAGDNVEHNLKPEQISSAIQMFMGGNMQIVSHKIDGYDIMYNGVYYYYPKPSSILYASAAVKNNLDLPLPKSLDLLNIYYQNHINIGIKEYNIKNKINPSAFNQINLVQLAPNDLIENLPVQITKADLVNDPTISNENKPQNTTSNTTQNTN